MTVAPWALDAPGATLLRVKAVPGASRDAVAGAVGDRLKIRVAAPPEGGKANRAILRVLADALGVRAATVTLVRGHGAAEKTIRVDGMAPDEVTRRLGE